MFHRPETSGVQRDRVPYRATAKARRHRFVAGQRNEQIGHEGSETNDVAVSGGIFESIGQLARSVRVNGTQGLPAFNEVAGSDVEVNASRLCVRGASELSNPAVVDRANLPLARFLKRVSGGDQEAIEEERRLAA
jgi:hypothetical protein